MKKYAVSIDNVLFYIISLSEKPNCAESLLSEITEGAYLLFLYPTGDVDFALECYNKNNAVLKEPYLPFSALSFFFREVRGLPLDEVSVDYFGKKYSLSICPYSPVEISLKPIKSKLLCTKTLNLSDMVGIVTYTAILDIVCLIVCVSDIDFLLDARLSRMRVIDGAPVADICIGVSYGDKIKVKSTSRDFSYHSIALAFSALIESGAALPSAAYSVELPASSHRVTLLDSGRLRFDASMRYLGQVN